MGRVNIEDCSCQRQGCLNCIKQFWIATEVNTPNTVENGATLDLKTVKIDGPCERLYSLALINNSAANYIITIGNSNGIIVVPPGAVYNINGTDEFPFPTSPYNIVFGPPGIVATVNWVVIAGSV